MLRLKAPGHEWFFSLLLLKRRLAAVVDSGLLVPETSFVAVTHTLLQ